MGGMGEDVDGASGGASESWNYWLHCTNTVKTKDEGGQSKSQHLRQKDVANLIPAFHPEAQDQDAWQFIMATAE